MMRQHVRRTNPMSAKPHFVTLGMFIIDEFSYLDEDGGPSGKSSGPQESLIPRSASA